LTGVVQIRVTPKTRNPFTISSLSISGVTWEWHFLNHAPCLGLWVILARILTQPQMGEVRGRASQPMRVDGGFGHLASLGDAARDGKPVKCVTRDNRAYRA